MEKLHGGNKIMKKSYSILMFFVMILAISCVSAADVDSDIALDESSPAVLAETPKNYSEL